MPLYLLVGVPYAVINLWIVWWFWRALRGAGCARVLICFLIVGLAVCFPFVYKRPGDSAFMIALVRVSALWLGMFLYIFFMVLAADTLRLLARLFGRMPAATPRYGQCLFIFSLAVCITMAGWLNAANPVVR